MRQAVPIADAKEIGDDFRDGKPGVIRRVRVAIDGYFVHGLIGGIAQRITRVIIAADPRIRTASCRWSVMVMLVLRMGRKRECSYDRRNPEAHELDSVVQQDVDSAP